LEEGGALTVKDLAGVESWVQDEAPHRPLQAFKPTHWKALQNREVCTEDWEPKGVCGISLLTAGALAGMLGPGRRFSTEAQLAAHAGVAPLEASSAGQVRHRLSRSGNRRLNAVFHRIAVTQSSHSERARAYLSRRREEGKTAREAKRALKRYLVRAVWKLWQECLLPPAAASTTGSREALEHRSIA
jgi:hypothetical protein